MTYLETERITLKEITQADIQSLLDLDSDPEVMTYLTDGTASSLDDVLATIKRISDLYQRYSRKFGVWAAYEKPYGLFIGWFLFRPCKKFPDDLKTIEIGYRLKKTYWGQGYASEVSKALIHKGFNELQVETVFATTMAKNSRSRRVMEKVGLIYEQSYTENQFPGADKDAVRYSLKR